MKQLFVSTLRLLFCVLGICACDGGGNSSEIVETPRPGGEDVGGSGSGSENVKTLVVYFSCTGNTKGIADHITRILSADEFRIEPAVPYSSADLNYNDNDCRANKEQNDALARPAIAKGISNVADYDVVYVGFPIWWGKLPKIMFTFLEAYDLGGKTIIPFCTSGSSGIGTAVSEIKGLEPKATVKDGKRFDAGASESTVKSWVDSQSK